MNQILLYSGGMDSYIAWHKLGKPPTLFVPLGHRYEEVEIQAVKYTIPDTQIAERVVLTQFEKPDAEIPARNLLLVLEAAWRGADKIWLVVQKDEKQIPDRSHKFLLKASKMISYLFDREVVVDTPFWAVDKTDMVRWYVENVGRDKVKELLCTVGCYNIKRYEDSHCGDCGACFRRYVAFMNNDIHPGYELSERIKSYYRERLHNYSLHRQERMIRWI